MHSFLAVESVPRTVVYDPPLSDPEFEEFCRTTDNVRIERNREGVIEVNPPAGGETGSANAEISRQLGNWWITHRRGLVFDSSAGFYLPDGSMLSPDAAYVGAEKLKGVPRGELKSFPRLCPDFVIELRSESDSLPAAKEKMKRWIENGVALGWLVSPPERQVYTFSPKRMIAFEGPIVYGQGPVDGFELNIMEVWSRYQD